MKTNEIKTNQYWAGIPNHLYKWNRTHQKFNKEIKRSSPMIHKLRILAGFNWVFREALRKRRIKGSLLCGIPPDCTAAAGIAGSLWNNTIFDCSFRVNSTISRRRSCFKCSPLPFRSWIMLCRCAAMPTFPQIPVLWRHRGDLPFVFTLHFPTFSQIYTRINWL